MRYVVEQDGRAVEVAIDVDPGGALRLQSGGAAHELRAGEGTTGLTPIELNGRRFLVGFARLADGRYQVVIDGVSRILQVTDPQATGADSGAGDGGGAIRAPIPGMVVTVHVEAGAAVESGAPLVTLYAMKLENEIRAPFAAVVAEIGAEAGKAVEKGELLVRLDRA